MLLFHQLPAPTESRTPLLRSVVHNLQVLVRGLAGSRIEGDRAAHLKFQSRLNRILHAFDEGSAAEDLDSMIAETVHALNEYHGIVGSDFKSLVSELSGMLRAMADTLVFLSASSSETVRQLNLMESKLQRITTVGDAKHTRALVDECLFLVRSETQHAQNSVSLKIASLEEEVARLTDHVNASSAEQDNTHDPLTLLPTRRAAEAAIAEKVCIGDEFVCALFVLDSMVSINNRFGRAAGDDILRKFAQYIAQTLGGATIYRWTGPAFLAMFDSKLSPMICESRSRRVASFRREEDFEKDDRSVLLVITCSLHLERMSTSHPPKNALKSIEAFVAAHWSVNNAA